LQAGDGGAGGKFKYRVMLGRHVAVRGSQVAAAVFLVIPFVVY